MYCARLMAVLALLSVSVVAPAQQPAKGEKADKGAAGKEAKPKKDKSLPVTAEETASAKRRTERLFGSDEPLEFTLSADFKAAFKSRDTVNVKTTKATLTVKDSSGAPVVLPVEIATRGHFRLRNDVCNFPPIRLIFPKEGLKGTPFAGQKALKLGTHCQTRDKEYSEYPVREHAVYETLNMLTQRAQGMGDSALMALKQLSQIVHRQAAVMSYSDAFFMLTVFYVGLSLLVVLVNKPASMAAGGDAH